MIEKKGNSNGELSSEKSVEEGGQLEGQLADSVGTITTRDEQQCKQSSGLLQDARLLDTSLASVLQVLAEFPVCSSQSKFEIRSLGITGGNGGGAAVVGRAVPESV